MYQTSMNYKDLTATGRMPSLRPSAALLALLVAVCCAQGTPEVVAADRNSATAVLPEDRVRLSGPARLIEAREEAVRIALDQPSGSVTVDFLYTDRRLDLSAFRDMSVLIANDSGAEVDVVLSAASESAALRGNRIESRFLVRAGEQSPLHMVLPRAQLPATHPFVARLGNLQAFPGGYLRHWQRIDNEAVARVSVRIGWFRAGPGATLTIGRPAGAVPCRLDDAALATLPLPLVDSFGQQRGASWPGKVLLPGEFARDAERDLALAADRIGPRGQRSRYGGDLVSPQHQATGFFRVEKVEGQWWFIDPEGHKFWSLGVNGAAGSSSTPVKGRPELFPEEVRGARTFDPYVENLKRKYGAEAWRARHIEVTNARLLQWGVNTIGAWSEAGLLDAPRLPYTLIAHPDLQGVGRIRKMIDPYSAGFLTSLDRVLGELAAAHAEDPWLLGVFIENELDWRGGVALANEVLRSPERTPARRALVSLLEQRYGEIAALNRAWGTQHASFEQVGPMSESTPSTACQKDLRDFTTAFADMFFEACARAMDRHFPHHLYLGCRLHSWNPLVTAAASRHCDVLSANVYRLDVADFRLTTTEDRPYLISEFHFGVRDFGLWGTGLVSAADARNQADLVHAYLSDALRHPNIVGAHWFQWSDQVVTGRSDGENFGVGLVSVVDRPHTQLAEAFTAVSDAAYAYRLSPTPHRIGFPDTKPPSGD